ncbi:drug/metabolite transporter (DMT)-like permease [Sedimentibacter acidaminivorans]|jgi:drug/metabolite transporter (DMT)-like permease|uniref:Drug/metabolite transporter (DMT)-like permease n=1 Tax=Sedimentibacter acidaminivorans TaxID=913099 RepID=A0ABS4GAT2_9FIRM|nr:EamA family transporter [Sedimentibacter acidaminivorans]MBP1924781.1 drug/metabolite transporter (DMT)-like permease [Sedimentibacter acidaminivorans]
MWLIYAIITTFSWAFSDLFYKKGAVLSDEASHIKTVIMVGLVMGLHGFLYMIVKGISFSPVYMITYFPVSFMYILSMALGYFGLRYIELSISSPIQNSSGAIASLLIFIFFTHILSRLEIFAIIIITTGIVALAILEKMDSNKSLILKENEKKYQKGILAITFPILYCIIDGLGTFADAIYLDELSLIGESEALLAYEFTFFICAVIFYIYLKIKKVRFNPFDEKDRGTAAAFETLGQFFYVLAMSRNAIITAPLIASYSVFSVLLSRIFLKERLTYRQYLSIAVVMIGILLLAISEAM